ncbi:Chitinase 2 [Chamberlinius hualienensis]
MDNRQNNVITIILTSLIASIDTSLPPDDGHNNFAVVCMYNNEASLRPFTAKLSVSDVDVTLCSHLVYMAITFDATDDNFVGTIPHIDNSPSGFSAATALRHQQQQPSKKTLKVYVMLTIDSQSTNYIENQAENFTEKIDQFLLTQKFDGLCLNLNVEQFNWNNLGILKAFKSLHMILEQNNLNLIAIVPFNIGHHQPQRDWIDFLNAIEYVGVATFNMHKFSRNSSYVNSHSALYGQNCSNMACAIDTWMKVGLQMNKIIVGIATHGVSFTLADAKNNGPLAPAVDHGAAGAYLRKKGVRAHYEICSSLKSESWINHFDQTALVPYVTSGRQWVGYEDATSITHKINYVKDKLIGGVFVWTIDMDDFIGLCGTPMPITAAIIQLLQQPNLVTTTTTPSTSTSANRYNCTNAGLFPHPFDCTKFIQCSEDLISHLMNCPAGLHFSQNNQICDWPDLANCTIGQEVTSDVTERPFNCKNKTGLFENPQNCSSFYWCNSGLLVGQSQCPEGLLFNGQIKVCDWPFNVNCNN